ncbi:MAG TPA: S41 family peptidase [Dehalococcoidia bacterium]
MAVSPHLVVHGDHRAALGRRLRFVPAAFVLLIVVAAGTALRGARLATAPSSGDSELYAIHAAVDDLNREFFRPVKTSDLLQSAWNADAALATKNGVPIARVPSPRLTEDADASFRSFDASYRELNRIATGKADARALGRASISAIAGAVHENHTYYIDSDRWGHRGDTSNNYAGIGITIKQKDGLFYVVEAYAGGPAAAAGLRPGDYLVSVDGVSVDGLTIDKLTGLLRGRPGTTVVVEARHGARYLMAELQRAAIVVPAFDSRILDGGVGYLRLRSFPPADAKLPDGQTVPQAIDTALQSFEQAGVTAWVLDLRNNPGGYLDTMMLVGGRLLPAGSPLVINQAHAGESVSRVPAGQPLPERPLAVLLNGSSASASEILASALQESGRASIVGEKSAGIANAANLDALPDGGGLSITSVQTLTPVQRRSLDGQGVLPDSGIAVSDEDIPLGRDRQLDGAVALVSSAAGTGAARP